MFHMPSDGAMKTAPWPKATKMLTALVVKGRIFPRIPLGISMKMVLAGLRDEYS